jgi:predicted oxidoreductase
VIRGKAVLLAAGGFGGNAEMGRKAGTLFRDAGRLLAGGNPNARGELHAIVARHGGRLDKMENVYGYANGTPDYRDRTGERGVVVRGPRSWIWVNREARRFHDEDMQFTGRTSTEALLKQTDQTCWAIFDETALADAVIQDHYQEPTVETPNEVARRYAEKSPYFHKAATLNALAQELGLSATALTQTIADWNALLKSGAGRDPLTRRRLAGIVPLDGSKGWRAVQFFPMLRKTLGGVATDLKGRVLDGKGQAIPGLYAAGELAGMGGGGLAGRHPLEGLMAGGSLFSGRVAARWAGRYVKRSEAAR